MTDKEFCEPGNFASRGFRLSSWPDEIEVVRDSRAFSPGQRAWRWAILLGAFILTGSIYFIQYDRFDGGHRRVHDSAFSANQSASRTPPDPMDLIFSIIWPITPLIFALKALYPGSDCLMCTRETAELKRTVWGKVRRVRTFQIAEVKRLQYVAEMFPWLGAAGCLGFLAEGKQVTCLSGLKRTEVGMLLAKLRGMGYDVLSEPEDAGEFQSEEPCSKE